MLRHAQRAPREPQGEPRTAPVKAFDGWPMYSIQLSCAIAVCFVSQSVIWPLGLSGICQDMRLTCCSYAGIKAKQKSPDCGEEGNAQGVPVRDHDFDCDRVLSRQIRMSLPKSQDVPSASLSCRPTGPGTELERQREGACLGGTPRPSASCTPGWKQKAENSEHTALSIL